MLVMEWWFLNVVEVWTEACPQFSFVQTMVNFINPTAKDGLSHVMVTWSTVVLQTPDILWLTSS